MSTNRKRLARASQITPSQCSAETSSQLELRPGPDLQYIRINGTVVGAGVGLVLHAIVLALA